MGCGRPAGGRDELHGVWPTCWGEGRAAWGVADLLGEGRAAWGVADLLGGGMSCMGCGRPAGGRDELHGVWQTCWGEG